jgi:uncharacterized DUF497 family protein
MEISYDAEKRALTLATRGLDFDDATHVFIGPSVTILDDRHDYGEVRLVTYGLLGARLVAVVWTPRGEARRIISMRKCNEREQEKFGKRLG